MIFSLWTDNGAMNSKPVFQAFEKSLKDAGCTVVHNSLDADVAVIWSVLWHGRMAQNKKVWDDFHAHNKKIIVLEDHSYIGGLGSIIKEVAYELKFKGKIHHLALKDDFLKEYSSQENLLKKHGITEKKIRKLIYK